MRHLKTRWTWLTGLMLTAAYLLSTQPARAQYDGIQAMRNVIPGGYNFWIYTPEDYYYMQEATPIIIFLHGASLCGHDLNRVRRYGPLDAVNMGRDIPALIIAPQNPGGSWSPKKINDVLEWTKQHYAVDTTRVYVYGMSLGGYGTMDFCGTYPEKVAAGMALCGGTTLKNVDKMGQVPLWIMHGTADRAISIRESQRVVNQLQASGLDTRLRYDWLFGASHGALARIFYINKTYDWLFAHSLRDPDRHVERSIQITQDDMTRAYRDIIRRPGGIDIFK